METDNGEDTGGPGAIGPVKIEWNWDLDNRWHEMKSIGSGDDKYGSPETGVGGFEAGWFGGQKRGG